MPDIKSRFQFIQCKIKAESEFVCLSNKEYKSDMHGTAHGLPGLLVRIISQFK